LLKGSSQLFSNQRNVYIKRLNTINVVQQLFLFLQTNIYNSYQSLWTLSP